MDFSLRYAIETGEDTRRSTAGIGAIVDVAVLETALSVPTAEIGLLECGARTDLASVLASTLISAVHDVDEMVWAHRVGAVPLTPVEAVIPARRLDEGLTRAERLAGYAARTVLLPPGSRPTDRMLTEAGCYGLGVCVGDTAERCTSLIAPIPMRVHRVSPEWWLFVENMYREHLVTTGDPRAQTSSLNQFSISARGFSLGR
ncbi:hypothetical protein [Leifsonia sp. LS1]|uniref:hypothetical protein n=1 Tax=Leifsonia sp. LS1 TaxID=2828483 RepID=UPI001CFD593F|nr:hypothetical protein [Leifsonia sp. LS1]